MKRLFAFASLIFLFFLFPISSHTQELDTDWLFYTEPDSPARKNIETIEGMVFVKGGCYDMGDTFGGGGSDEKPVHTVCVDDFYIGETE